MKKIKLILLNIWKFISIFGLAIAVVLFLIELYMVSYIHKTYYRIIISQHKCVLNLIKERQRPTIKEIQAVFGEGRYFSSSFGKEELEKSLFKKEIKEKFKQYPSMFFIPMGAVNYFIFFDKEGRMVDFIVDET